MRCCLKKCKQGYVKNKVLQCYQKSSHYLICNIFVHCILIRNICTIGEVLRSGVRHEKLSYKWLQKSIFFKFHLEKRQIREHTKSFLNTVINKIPKIQTSQLRNINSCISRRLKKASAFFSLSTYVCVSCLYACQGMHSNLIKEVKHITLFT